MAQIAGGATEMTGNATTAPVIEQLDTSVTPPGVRKALTRLPSEILSNPREAPTSSSIHIFANWLRERGPRDPP
jgi:hypothetical protein